MKEKTYNIEDYLEWRADVPFSTDPFNEVDNLVLCELAYTKIGDVLPPGESMGLKELRDRFFETHSREELREINTFMTKAPLLMDLMASGERFGNLIVNDLVDEVDDESDMQIAAMTFLLDDGTAYVCFRGTDYSVAGWKENFSISYLKETSGQKAAVRYLERTAIKTDRMIRVGGHSKGGNFAVFAASFCHPDVQERILEVYSNDGPGMRKEVTLTEGYERMKKMVISIIPNTSIVGQVLTHDFPDILIHSRNKGFMQHDGFSWCVERNRFVRAERTDLGEFIRRTIADWLSKMDDDTRRAFVNDLFGLIESTEADTLQEISLRKLESAERMISSAFGLPEEEQQKLFYTIIELLRSGRDKAMELLLEILSRELNEDTQDATDA